LGDPSTVDSQHVAQFLSSRSSGHMGRISNVCAVAETGEAETGEAETRVPEVRVLAKARGGSDAQVRREGYDSVT